LHRFQNKERFRVAKSAEIELPEDDWSDLGHKIGLMARFEPDRDYGLNTLIAHLGEDEKIKGAVVPPIFQNSLFLFETIDDLNGHIREGRTDMDVYSRVSNPTTSIAEKKIAAIEGTEEARLFNSGMAAISAAILSALDGPAHVVAVDTCYGPTRQFLDYLSRYGVTTTYIEGTDPDAVIAAIRPGETQAVYLESPSSVLFLLQDLTTICRYCREHGVTTILDNSYSAGVFQKPASFGVDLVVHSATKYFGGHSDVVAGAVAGSKERLTKMTMEEISLFGAILPPFPSWLILRGLRTLTVRLKHHQEAANHIAKWLQGTGAADVVHHVGLDSFPQAALRDRQMTGTSGLLSFEPKVQDGEKVKAFANHLGLFGRGVSWGGFESLVVAFPTHPMHYESSRWIVRLNIGLEEPADLIADIQQALHASELLP
jgi:cystathionine beta-lyase/cystathionine gamma-synthase